MNNPWKNLNFETILSSVEEVIGEKLTNLCLKRNSYINRVYELEKQDKSRLIVKYYRPGRWTADMIFTEHSFLEFLAAKDISVITPMEYEETSLFQLEDIYFAIFPKKGGRALDEFDEETWKQLGRLIGRMHSLSTNYNVKNRVIWTPDHATPGHIKTILNSNCVLPEFIDSFKNISNLFLQKATLSFEHTTLVPLHGDLHKGNFVIRPGEGMFLTDFDDMSVGPAIQDIWMLLSDIQNMENPEITWLKNGYELFKDFPTSQLKLIPYLRGMRIIHYVAWIAMQYQDEGFDELYPDFKTPRYWNETIRELQQISYS